VVGVKTTVDDSGLDAALAGQQKYYSARAGEYDEWWWREGRYDRGTELNARWRGEALAVESALARFSPTGRVLELACGTGLWTQLLARSAATLTAVDGSAEMLELNRARIPSRHVEYIQADIFQWQPSGPPFDGVFFSFWLSHVPPVKFAEFWKMVAACLKPNGRVFFVDSRREASSTATNHMLPSDDSLTLRRRLNDGREFEIYKVFYEPADLTRRLAELGWDFEVNETAHYFIYGSGSRR
jgi:2-polyprenyl-3-methyl-5-hydroxy-6-metoxy-1,4-benzoquinol methylase